MAYRYSAIYKNGTRTHIDDLGYWVWFFSEMLAHGWYIFLWTIIGTFSPLQLERDQWLVSLSQSLAAPGHVERSWGSVFQPIGCVLERFYLMNLDLSIERSCKFHNWAIKSEYGSDSSTEQFKRSLNWGSTYIEFKLLINTYRFAISWLDYSFLSWWRNLELHQYMQALEQFLC